MDNKEIDIRINELQMARNTVCFSEQSLEQRNYFDARIRELYILKNKEQIIFLRKGNEGEETILK